MPVELRYRFAPLVEYNRREERRASREAYRKLFGTKWRERCATGLLEPGSYVRLGKGKVVVLDVSVAAKAIAFLEAYGYRVEARCEPEGLKALGDPLKHLEEAWRRYEEAARLLEEPTWEAVDTVLELRAFTIQTVLRAAGIYATTDHLNPGSPSYHVLLFLQKAMIKRRLDRELARKLAEELRVLAHDYRWHLETARRPVEAVLTTAQRAT